jgi:hypothetical protein
MPIPWPEALLPEGAVLGFAMAIAGSLVGAWIGARLAADRIPRAASLRVAACLGALAIAGMVGYALYKPADDGVRGTISVDRVGGGEAIVGVRLDPPGAAADPEWFQTISWQGGGLVLDDLLPTGAPGSYATSGPVPISGDWKTLVRLHEGSSLTGLPVYLPRDPAIPVGGVPVRDGVTRTFIADHEILQREQKTAAGWLWAVAYAIVLAITLGFLALLVWGLHRLACAAEPDRGPAARATAGRSVAPLREPAPITR